MNAQSPPTQYRGSLDVLSGDQIKGWAFDESAPDRHVDVRLVIDGNALAPVSADRYRADLEQAGIGSGDHAFSIVIPVRFYDGKTHQFQIFDARSGTPITPQTPFVCPDAERSAFEGAVDGVVDGVLYGWAWNWTNVNIRCRVTIKAGPMVLGTFVAQRARPDLAERGIGDGRYGFAVRMPTQLPHELQPISVHVAASGFELTGSPLHLGFADTIAELNPDIRRQADAANILSSVRHRLEHVARQPLMNHLPDNPDAAALVETIRLLRTELKVLQVMTGPHLGVADLPVMSFPDLANPSYSLVLLDQQNAATTFQLLANLGPATIGRDAEILIHVAARSGMAAHFRRIFPAATILETPQQAGPRDVLALAAQQAKTPTLVFVGADIVVGADALTELVATVRDDNAVGIAGMKVLGTAGRVVSAGASMAADGTIMPTGAQQAAASSALSFVRTVDFFNGGVLAIANARLTDTLGKVAGMSTYAYQWFVIARMLNASGYRAVYTPFASARCTVDAVTDGVVEAMEADRKAIFRNYGRMFGTIGTAVKSLASPANPYPHVLLVTAAETGWQQGLSFRCLVRRAALFKQAGFNVSVMPNGRRFDSDSALTLCRRGIHIIDTMPDTPVDRVAIELLKDGDIVYFDKPMKWLAEVNNLRSVMPGLRLYGGLTYEDKAAMDEGSPFARHRGYECFDRLLVETGLASYRIDISEQVAPLPVPVLPTSDIARFESTALALIEPTPPDALRAQSADAMVTMVAALADALPGVKIDCFHATETSLLPAGSKGLRDSHNLSTLCVKGLSGYRIVIGLCDDPAVVEAVASLAMESLTPLLSTVATMQQLELPAYPIQARLVDAGSMVQNVGIMYTDPALWAQAQAGLAQAARGFDLDTIKDGLPELLNLADVHGV